MNNYLIKKPWIFVFSKEYKWRGIILHCYQSKVNIKKEYSSIKKRLDMTAYLGEETIDGYFLFPKKDDLPSIYLVDHQDPFMVRLAEEYFSLNNGEFLSLNDGIKTIIFISEPNT